MTGRLTQRLRLVPIGPEHADDLFRGRAWRDDGVQKWLAYDRESGELVGRGGLSYAEVDGVRRLEIGWAVRERWWGRGYATEIGRAGLAFAFEELLAPEVVAFTETHNRRSRMVMERLGFRFDHEMSHRGEAFVLYVRRACGP
jgi:ribosomal-protein-alanine N-acetyltransferase